MGIELGVITAIAAGVAAIGAVAGATTGIVGGVMDYQQAKSNAAAQQNMLEYNARQERREADAVAAESNEAARRQRLEDERIKAAQRAAYGKSGAAMTSGSPLAVLGDTAAQMELGVQDVHRSGAIGRSRRLAEATSYSYQGRIAGSSVSKGMLWGSVGGSIASGLQGVGGAVSGGINSYVGVKSAQTKGIIKG